MSRWPQLGEWVRLQVLDLVGQGMSAIAACRRAGVSQDLGGRWIREAGISLARGHNGGMTGAYVAQAVEFPQVRPSHGARLDLADRTLIHVYWSQGWSMRKIAAELGVAPSTICREIARGSTAVGYRAPTAQERADRMRARPKPRKLDADPLLRARVIEGLNAGWSPEQVSGRLERWWGEEAAVSHETIYQALYVQGAGSLRHELEVASALRSGRKGRRPRSRLPARGNRPWVTGHEITTRPPQADDRAIPGHWEGDLIIGAGGANAVITLVERRSRALLMGRLATDHDSATVAEALGAMVAGLPDQVQVTTLTWDQGTEMAQSHGFAMASHIDVFFCDPHSPWQRPTNENTNGLIRQYFPKGTDFSQVSDTEIARVQDLLNDRPRKVLGYATPREILFEQFTVALTD